MNLTEVERKTLNGASKDVRMAKKKIDAILDSNSQNKQRRQETADSDECKEKEKS